MELVVKNKNKKICSEEYTIKVFHYSTKTGYISFSIVTLP